MAVPTTGAAPARPTPAAEPLRPATLTDMLDGGYRLLRSRPGAVLGLSALFVVPPHVFSGIANRAAIEDLGALLGGAPVLGLGADSASGYDLVLLIVSAVLRSLALLYLGVALTYVVLAQQEGQRLGARQAARMALRRSGAVLGSWPLLAAAGAVAYAACFLPLGVWVTFTAVVAPAIAAEGIGPIAAIGRSFRLTARRFFPALAVVLLSTLVAAVLDTVLLLLPQSIAVALPSPYGWVVAMVASAAASTVTSGPLVLSCTLLYLDLRVRTEGLDLRQRATAAFTRAG